MSKALKFWNGRGHGDFSRLHISVAAYSLKEAAELVGQACGLNDSVGVHEIRTYYSQSWGNLLKEITPDKPCVYIDARYRTLFKWIKP